MHLAVSGRVLLFALACRFCSLRLRDLVTQDVLDLRRTAELAVIKPTQIKNFL